MNAVFGVIFHFIGGFASGSFYVPYKKVKGWSWESMWILGGLFSWIIVPPIAAILTIPNFLEIIRDTNNSILGYTFLFGLLWGIGGLTYGLGVRYLGVSLGSSIILGLSMVFGSLMPSIYYFFNRTEGKHGIDYFFTTHSGICILIGLLVCVLGVFLCGKAGVSKEKHLSALSAESKSDYNFGLGIVVAIISGILSACFNFGIEAGKPMADVANTLWKTSNPNQGEFLYQNNVTYIVILWGGFVTNFLWCLYLLFKNRTFGDYTKSDVPKAKNFLLCAIAGTTWYLQFFFYGMGESRLGNGASSWILHMAFIILISNAWGVVLKEWKGVDRSTYRSIIGGIVTIIISICIVGFAKTLEN
ncbi:L-rhamnose/proton symporter RhaT [Sphingobacterium paramultivorum]|uniref:L-rhamnose/proton symporter RhaT n=1 Tax=Sphingobacterium paramultivorum TaxID=2886510 RepID=A0A7G5E8M3_9SPHI|nr:L-rhamnose/proton symporter RhaT [Sphingobacterium paramultivorum]QMV70348.1 L-rhamnose/proton symporter RhaT [Sphingobacterium paramultivorum]WSO14201.1 L-rhamnose/proton symporter RhaT [Sphingobacterium paramultivorum]